MSGHHHFWNTLTGNRAGDLPFFVKGISSVAIRQISDSEGEDEGER
jgi:hypothetical protein